MKLVVWRRSLLIYFSHLRISSLFCLLLFWATSLFRYLLFSLYTTAAVATEEEKTTDELMDEKAVNIFVLIITLQICAELFHDVLYVFVHYIRRQREQKHMDEWLAQGKVRGVGGESTRSAHLIYGKADILLIDYLLFFL